jgi:hypothetical protein
MKRERGRRSPLGFGFWRVQGFQGSVRVFQSTAQKIKKFIKHLYQDFRAFWFKTKSGATHVASPAPSMDSGK